MREVIIRVAKARSAVLRLEAELENTRANLKVAKSDLNLALANLAEYAEKQLAFAFEAPAE